MGNNIATNIQTNIQNSIASTNAAQQPQKQRVFTGTITKLCADFGFVDEDVFFQTRLDIETLRGLSSFPFSFFFSIFIFDYLQINL